MNSQLVEILPHEIKFIFEVKKQSSCDVHLTNVAEQYVAFKVKTTSPKKYCVRPNVGIIKPKSTCDFTVTMQAQKYAPSEMLCKDKFLIQSTVVPFGTTEEEIMPGMFAKGHGNYIEETKIRVVFTSSPNAPEKLPVHEILKQEASYATLSPENSSSPVLLPVNGVSNQEPAHTTSMPEVKLLNGVENLPPPDMPIKKVEAAKIIKNAEESSSLKVKEKMKLVLNSEEFYVHKDEESKQVEDAQQTKLNLTRDIEELQLKISALNSELVKAECIIMRLQEENMSTIHGKDALLRQLAILRRTSSERKVRIGFPPMFVCMVVLISLVIGFTFRC